MNIVELVVLGMIVIIIATITLAVLSYGAFKVREGRSPKRTPLEEATEPMFFERVHFFRDHEPRP